MKVYKLEMTLSDSVNEDKVNIGWTASEVFGAAQECIDKAVSWYCMYWPHIVGDDNPTMEVNARSIGAELRDRVVDMPGAGCVSVEYGYPVEGYDGLIEITVKDIEEKGANMLDNVVDEQEQRLLKKELDEFHRMDRFIADHQLQHPVWVYCVIRTHEGYMPTASLHPGYSKALEAMAKAYAELTGEDIEQAEEKVTGMHSMGFLDKDGKACSLTILADRVDKNKLEDADHA